MSLCGRTAAAMTGKNSLCEVETGQTNIILDIEESRGNSKYSIYIYIYLYI